MSEGCGVRLTDMGGKLAFQCVMFQGCSVTLTDRDREVEKGKAETGTCRVNSNMSFMAWEAWLNHCV